MKVAVMGATGVVGSSAVQALVDAGHDVFTPARTPDQAALLKRWGATAVDADPGDHLSLVSMFEGCDVVVNVAARCPVGTLQARPSEVRANDRRRVEGTRRVVAAAREAHVRRLVQESSSLLYADAGDSWIDEDSPLEISPVTEPGCVAESLAEDFRSGLRQVVVLRLGMLVGDDPVTRRNLQTARRGRPVCLGSPEGWLHLLHTEDVGPAVAAALTAPSGTYNVGAEPVRRRVLLQAYADAVGRERLGTARPWRIRYAGRRAEPATRSLRVSSERFRAATGWVPRRPNLDASWLRPVELALRAG